MKKNEPSRAVALALLGATLVGIAATTLLLWPSAARAAKSRRVSSSTIPPSATIVSSMSARSLSAFGNHRTIESTMRHASSTSSRRANKVPSPSIASSSSRS